MAAARSAAAACDALRRALSEKLRAPVSRLRDRYSCILGSASTSVTLTPLSGLVAVVLCVAAAFPRAAAFFLPLVASTSLCCATACLSAAAAAKEREAGAVEVVLAGRGGEGKAPEPGLLQVIGDANATAYGGGVQVGCFLRRSAWQGVGGEEEEVVFAGTLAPCATGSQQQGLLPPRGGMEVEEELAAMRVDSFAEGVWDSYFGGWSRWHDAYAA